MTHKHGGDIQSYIDQYGRKPLDFSANTSFLGMPESAAQAAVQAVSSADCYPDPYSRELRRALSRYHKVPETYLFCGNGAGDVTARLISSIQPKEALITAPTFSEYAAALNRCRCRLKEYPLSPENDFVLKESVLDWITPETDLVILCEPNNPSGVVSAPELIRHVAERCRSCGCVLLLDECFLDFLPDEKFHSGLSLILEYPVVVIRAFTKFYGMAGLRLGYCISGDRRLIESLYTAGPAWPVSSVAQSAGVAALEDRNYPDLLRNLVQEERNYLSAALKCFGFHVINGRANYLLFHTPEISLGKRLYDRGILIRDCSDYHGLCPGWFRIAVRNHEDNQRLIITIKEILNG